MKLTRQGVRDLDGGRNGKRPAQPVRHVAPRCDHQYETIAGVARCAWCGAKQRAFR